MAVKVVALSLNAVFDYFIGRFNKAPWFELFLADQSATKIKAKGLITILGWIKIVIMTPRVYLNFVNA